MTLARTLQALALVPVLALASTSTLAQGDAVRGAGKAAMCIGCHGIVGYQASFPEVYKVPMIAGQSAKYVGSALQAYAKGDRKHPTMRSIAASLSEQDMADLGAYYEQLGGAGSASVPATLAQPLPDALKDRMAACTACHGANFSAPIDGSYPRLAGQHADYLYAALRAYGTDGRALVGRSNAMMRGQVVQESEGQKKAVFSPTELRQIAAYLAGLPGQLQVVPQPRLR
ncbi:c-type cytochrome [Pseudaquabacterium rugosum]|jgi:cytochrome c553|uniref:C-type cytochrome n=1 Tax=Pseudaquabacterium rugosum TaxID=2984194 RepID=A0ABU9B790_9BURK